MSDGKIECLENGLLGEGRLARIRRALLKAGAGEAYLTGGAVRDACMGREGDTSDYDVALPRFDAAFAGRFASAYGGTAFCLDEETCAWRVTDQEGEDVDLVAYRGTTIVEDLKGRDFTVNALAYDLLGDSGALDPLGGQEALHYKVLALCGPDALNNDPLRVLRAYRFLSVLGLEFAPGLEKHLAAAAPKLRNVSPERVRYEIFRLLAGKNGSKALRLAIRDGAWEVVFPFIKGWKGFDQGSYHSHDLLEHSLQAFENVDKVVVAEIFDPVREKLAAHLAESLEADITRLALLKFTAFCHDIAKPDSLTVEETGRRRFIGHDSIGAKTVGRLLLRKKAGKKAARAASSVVAAHMRLFGLANQKSPTLRSRLRYLRDLGSEAPEAVLLSIADELATGDRDPAERDRIWRTCAELLELYFGREEKVEPLIRGRDLVKILGMEEGPLVGIVLAAVADAETNGTVTTREEALEYARMFSVNFNDY